VASLDGKVIIISGAGRGLGRAFAEAVCREGAKVAIAEIVEEWGERAAGELTAAGHEAWFIRTDIAEWPSVQRMAESVAERWGRIDGLVNNGAIASGIGGKGFEEIPVEEWDRVMRVNVRGPWLSTRAAVPFMRRTDKAKIVNVASDTALWGAPVLLHYVGSKGAVIAMTRAMARELGKDGICVNAIAPGLTLVEATETVAQSRHEAYVAGRALQRPQQTDDVTGAVLFLLSDAADFITGQTLAVNGGFVLH
jgi:NAD(P)-dependent dehydrogenase (short-subunit alcohol dehydrogenase family)